MVEPFAHLWNMLSMLEHVVCPHCGAENLTTEAVCFACGKGLGKPVRAQEPPPETPRVFYLGALGLVALFGVFVFFASQVIADYRQQAAVSASKMLVLVIALAVFGQYGFYLARRQDRSYWELKRAPQLPLKQAGPGDAVWLRGTVACDSPLDVPFLVGQKCVYFELRVRERSTSEQRGWHTTQHDKQAVDFLLREGEESLYIPTGQLHFEAPVCVDNYPDPLTHVRVRALFLGWQVSVCGRVVGDPPQRRLDQLSEAVPAVITYQFAVAYLADLSKSERLHRAAGWVMSVLAAILLLATFVRR